MHGKDNPKTGKGLGNGRNQITHTRGEGKAKSTTTIRAGPREEKAGEKKKGKETARKGQNIR